MEFWGQVSAQHVNFEGSLAEMLRFWSSKFHLWRKFRTKASFLSFKTSFLKEVSQKSFVFELQNFNFEGSFAQKLRFWASKLQFWRKSRKKVSFLSFKTSILKEVSHKSFVFELQSFNFEGSLAEKLHFWSSKPRFWRTSRRKASFLSFKASILKEVSHKSFVWQNHLNHISGNNQITWTSNYLQPSAFRRPSSLLLVCRLQKNFVNKMLLCKSRACIKATLV